MSQWDAVSFILEYKESKSDIFHCQMFTYTTGECLPIRAAEKLYTLLVNGI